MCFPPPPHFVLRTYKKRRAACTRTTKLTKESARCCDGLRQDDRACRQGHAALRHPQFFDLAAEMPDCISLGVGEPDFKTPWAVRDAALRAWSMGRTRYTANAGLKRSCGRESPALDRRMGLHYDPWGQILLPWAAARPSTCASAPWCMTGTRSSRSPLMSATPPSPTSRAAGARHFGDREENGVPPAGRGFEGRPHPPKPKCSSCRTPTTPPAQ